MSTRQPVQKRSRERIEQILLAAADQLAKTGDANELTTTSVSKRSGVPVATIYRYFADRMAIIATLIDRETDEIDRQIVARLDELEVVTLESLLETLMIAHLSYFQENRRAIVLWFGARSSSRVSARVDRRYAYLGEWVFEGARRAEMSVPDAPSFGGELITWMGDRVFEFIFREERSKEEQEAIMGQFLQMMTTQILRYATPRGVEGVPRDEFLAKAGPWAPSPSESVNKD